MKALNYILRISLFGLLWCTMMIWAAPERGLFTIAYENEKNHNNTYSQAAVEGFTTKLNAALLTNPLLAQISASCGDCDPIMSGFDSYVAKNLPNGKSRTDYAVAAASYFAPGVDRVMSAQTVSALNQTILGLLQNIQNQVTEQRDLAGAISSAGLYNDNDLTNSPYDLMDDLARIDRVFFDTPSEKGDYKNTIASDGPAIINGQIQQWAWAQGDTYEIDLLGDIAGAMGGGKSGKKKEEKDDKNNCDTGFCISIDVVPSKHYLIDASGKWSGMVTKSYQSIFASLMETLVKRWDKKSLACKSAPTMNMFESTNDQGLNLGKIFRGLGIHVTSRTPPFLANTNPSSKEAAKAVKDRDRATEDTIVNALKQYGIDATQPSDMTHTLSQALLANIPTSQKASDTEATLRLRLNNQVAWSQSPSNKSDLLAIRNDSQNGLKVTYGDLLPRIKSIWNGIKSVEDMLKNGLTDKPDCGN